MRSAPNLTDESDVEDLTKLNAKEWQVALLNKNPHYVYWGNYEDYMSDKKGGWSAPAELETFKDIWGLDELNELVNFYFELYRVNHQCPHCEGDGSNPATKQLSDDWYDFDVTGRKWSDKIGEVEVDALMKHGRLEDPVTGRRCHYDEETNKWTTWNGSEIVEIEKPTYPTPKDVNDRQHGKGFGHDAINRWICIEARAKDLGVYGKCEHCEGSGMIYDEPEAKIALQLWFLHPRKGCSRGVYVKNIEESDVPNVIEYLKEAAKRNAERFSKL